MKNFYTLFPNFLVAQLVVGKRQDKNTPLTALGRSLYLAVAYGGSYLTVDHEWYVEFSSGCYKCVSIRGYVSPRCDMTLFGGLIPCTRNLFLGVICNNHLPFIIRITLEAGE